MQETEKKEEKARNTSEQERVKALQGLDNLEKKIRNKQD